MSESSIVWPQAALDAVAQLQAKIPPEYRLSADFIAKYPPRSDVRGAATDCGILTAKELDITSLETDSVSLLSRIKSKEFTAVEVTRAFTKRAAVGQQLLHYLTDFFPDEALKRAQELDDLYERTGQLVGPLHGLPIDIKANMMVEGTKASSGFVVDCLQPEATQHGLIAQILYDAGAVFYAKTNLPQSIMHLETYSFWGETRNPWNTALTPGGSSGGSSALVAFGGSTMGVGSDIGGSLRSPANACGIWTLKPTTQRLPKGSGCVPMLGADSILSTYGPLCRSLRDVELFFSTIIATKPWLKSPDLVPIPWHIPTAPSFSGTNGRLRVGVMWHDGVVLPQPPIRRALKEFAEKLRKDQSIEVVDYTPFKHKEAGDLAHALYFVDGGARIRAKAAEGGEPLVPLTQWVITRPTVKNHNISELWEVRTWYFYLELFADYDIAQLIARRDGLRVEYLAHFNAQNLDVVLCPAGAGPAPVLGTCKYWGYTNVWNFLDYPAAVFPTGALCDPAIDLEDTSRQYMSDADEYNARCYDAQVFKDMPLALQLVSRRYSEEFLVCALRQISSSLPLQ
ncbi:Amidase domain-containing protein [Mycena chlorophos]|uniref:amidase n=1 Tax=Mycena chlorophos TaxID=658473 RepID=A0A8H6ST53_MYCCL|nr:Amidase domain-containing protein [Mycena chlorophos]